MRNTFVDTIIAECSKRDDIFVISGDAGLGVFDRFKDEYPDRFLNMGVAEQNMISFAAGLTLVGYKVILYNIIPFVLYRCYEQVRNDICYQELPIVLAGIGSGVTYAPMGMTHYSVEDIGVAQTLPNLTVISPIDPIEARLAAQYSLTADVPVYVRLAKRGEPNLHKTAEFDIMKPQLLVEGAGVAIVFHGSVGGEVLKANDLLRDKGICPKIIAAPVVLPMDVSALFELLEGTRHVFIVEEHFQNSGLFDILAREFARLFSDKMLHSVGIKDEFIHAIRDNAGMRDLFGLSAPSIARTVKAAVKC